MSPVNSTWHLLRIAASILMFAHVVGIAAFYPLHTHAALINYGGRTLFATPCTCTEGCWLLTIGPPGSRPPGIPEFMYCPSTTQMRMNYNIFEPAWQLGYAGPPRACTIYAGTTCAPRGVGPVMLLDGTSLY